MAPQPLTDIAAVRPHITRAIPDNDAQTLGLILIASRLARTVAPGLDDRITAGAIAAEEVSAIVALAVAGALRNPEGARTVSRTRGPFSESITYPDGSTGELGYSATMVLALGGSTGSVRRARSIQVRPALA